MIYSIVKDPLSYFRSFRDYFVVIFGLFLAFPVRELVLVFYPVDSFLLFSSQLIVTSGVGIAASWGYLATKLYVYPEPFSFQMAFRSPSRLPHLFFLIYLIPMVSTFGVAWFLAPIRTDSNALYVLDGLTYHSIVYSPVLLSFLLSVAVAFTIYPNFVLFRLRAQLKDKQVRYALMIFASCFGAIASILLSLNALSTFGYSVLGLGHITGVILLSITVRAFRKPSFLKAFLGVLPDFDTSPTLVRRDQTVVLFSNEEQKNNPFSTYIIEGLNKGHSVVYFHQGPESSAKERLSQSGLDVSQHLQNGNLKLKVFGSLYGEGSLNEESVLAIRKELESEARNHRREALRILVDYGFFSKQPIQELARHLTDARWSRPDGFVKVLMALDQRLFDGQERILSSLKDVVPTVDLAESSEVFSRSIGVSHDKMIGRKILLQYDPLSDYERVLKTLVAEVASNLERVLVITRSRSPIDDFVGGEPGLKKFILTSRVSQPQIEHENRVLIPATNSSLLIDAVSKAIEAYASMCFTVIVDNISHLAFTVGFDKTYLLVRQVLELIASEKITAVFLMNSGAHDPKQLSAFRNLFDIELLCNVGARVPEVRKGVGFAPGFGHH